MHLVTCMLRVGNDGLTVLKLGEQLPCSFPETFVLAHIHGPGSVSDIQLAGETESTSEEEYGRLYSKYGAIVERLFPGLSPTLPLEMPKAPAGRKGKTAAVDEP